MRKLSLIRPSYKNLGSHEVFQNSGIANAGGYTDHRMEVRDHNRKGNFLVQTYMRQMNRVQQGDIDSEALAAVLPKHIEGEVRFDNGSRALYSTDASNYRHVPVGVVIPRTIFVPPAEVENVLSAMRSHPLSRDSQIIGEVVSDHPGIVVMTTRVGGSRVVDMLSGEQLPRIC